MEDFALARILKFLPGIILGLTVHEFSHAYIAYRCGDSTSKEQGRLTLNPFKHIDLLGFMMLMVAGFGWAKPVEFNEQNLRNPEKDVIKIAVAGPFSNALTAIVLSVLYSAFFHFIPAYQVSWLRILQEVLLYAIYINWGLFIFNLIPLPPLDGSHLLLNYFKKFPSLYEAMYKYGSYIFFGLILVMVITKINVLPIGPVINFLTEGLLTLLNGLFPA
ncbi:MAG: site-2 protease family protein [Bacteroidales bacterium]